MTEETFSNARDQKIFLRSFRASAPRAVVAIVHGFNSHSGQYLWVAEQLVQKGLSVYALDLHGRGKSDGERFYVEKFADYVDDVTRMVDIVKAREPGLPIFVLGHSAGGVVACMYVLEHQADVRGLVCESFAFRVPAPDFVLATLKGLSHLAPHAHVLALKNADFSRDPKIVAAMDADPLIAHESQPTLTVAEMVRADELLEKAFPRFTVPLLILHGTADKATSPKGSQLFHEQAGSKDKTLKLYDGHFHDLLNDVGREGVLSDIQKWIDAHI
jgi:alpha-beta hydrolase superfamily lysophospholipase